MLETKFGLKYPMPHVLVHIVDNSSYTGELGVLTADDPSMYGTLVVTGAPMGEDNRVISVNRSDILNVAYGLGTLGTGDIQKYGQTVTYPLSLIEQGAPVKLMRVTPDNACYAYSCITVEWRWNEDENVMHVRYNTFKLSDDRSLSNYSNKERLNAKLVKEAKSDNIPADKGDPNQNPWKRRAFIVNISAGRGSAYNTYTTSINQTIQGKRPANVRYLFTTYDTVNGMTVEQFYASLLNVDNKDRSGVIDSVNVAVKKRADGSSVVVNFVNELAIRELYNDYRTKYAELMEDDVTVVTDYIREAYAFTNINTFDPIFGLYIYNGTDEQYKLPFFQVDMRGSDIVMLPKGNRVYTTDAGDNAPQLVAPKVMPLTYGVTRDGDNVYIGDVYLYSGKSSLTNPYLYIVTGINQFSGAVTTIKTNLLNYDDKAVKLTAIVESNTATAVSDITEAEASVKSKLRTNAIKPGDIIAWYTSNDEKWTLYYIKETATATTFNFTNDATEISSEIDELYKLIDWANIENHGNIIAVKYGAYDPTNDSAYGKTGSGYIDATTGTVWIAKYDSTPSSPAFDEITNMTAKYAQPATTIAVDSNVIGTEFDVITVSGEDSEGYTVNVEGVVSEQFSNAGAEYLNTINTDNKLEFKSTVYTLTTEAPADWATAYTSYFTKTGEAYVAVAEVAEAPAWTENTYYSAESTVSLFDSTIVPTAGAFCRSKLTNFEMAASNDKSTRTTGDYVYTTYDPVQAYYNDGVFYSDSEHTSAIVGDVKKVYQDFESGKYYRCYRTTGEEPTDVYEEIAGFFRLVVKVGDTYQYDTANQGSRASGILFTGLGDDVFPLIVNENTAPTAIHRYMVTGTIGSLFRIQQETNVVIPSDYYSDSYGINITMSEGGVKLEDGYAGFFDDAISDIEFKWRYSQLLVDAFRGRLDPRIMSPARVPAKYMFDGGTNTIVGQTILPSVTYKPADLINASTIFTADEKDEILLNPDIITWDTADIDVKQAMYDLMVYRCFYGMPEDKRPLGPGYGFQLHLDSGNSDSISDAAINNSFLKRFDNPNASWDIGGYVAAADGLSYTYMKRLADNLVRHCKTNTVNKPFTGNFTMIKPDEYLSFFPDIDMTDWDYRELMYNSGGNAWIPDINGNLVRKSQRTLMRSSSTSDLLQESNMRTLSQLCYMLHNKLEEKLFEYNDDSVLKTMSDECNNMFSNWVGNLVESLEITFKRDINPQDGGEIVVCNVKVTFRGITLRIPVVVNVNRRAI